MRVSTRGLVDRSRALSRSFAGLNRSVAQIRQSIAKAHWFLPDFVFYAFSLFIFSNFELFRIFTNFYFLIRVVKLMSLFKGQILSIKGTRVVLFRITYCVSEALTLSLVLHEPTWIFLELTRIYQSAKGFTLANKYRREFILLTKEYILWHSPAYQIDFLRPIEYHSIHNLKPNFVERSINKAWIVSITHEVHINICSNIYLGSKQLC